MKLFDIIDELPVPSDEARTIKEFRQIIVRDKGSKGDHDGRKKLNAIKELAFVHWYCTFDTRFESYETEAERNEAIKVAVGLPEDWEPDIDIRRAIERYNDMITTESMVFVKSLREGLEGVRKAISSYTASINAVTDNEEGNEETSHNVDLRNAKVLNDLIEKSPKTLQALIDAKKVVEKELQDKFGNNSKKVRSMINDFVDSASLENKRI